MNISVIFYRKNIPNLLGFFYCIGIPILSCVNAIGYDVNISIFIAVVSIIFYPFIIKFQNRKDFFYGSSLALLFFSLLSILITIPSILYLNEMPFLYLQSKVLMLLVCPLSFFVGFAFIKNTSAEWTNLLFNINLFICISFGLMQALFPENITDEDGVAGSYYHYLGDTLVVSALINYAIEEQKNSFLSNYRYVLTAVALILLGSRASFIVFTVSILFTRASYIFIASAAVILSILPLIMDFLEERSINIRVLGTMVGHFVDEKADHSSELRDEMAKAAMTVIYENPFTGQFGYDSKEIGSYIHSMFDIWAQFGVFSFIAFFLTIIWNPFFTIINDLVKLKLKKRTNKFIPIMIFLLLQFSLFRHPSSVILFFGMGGLAFLSISKKSLYLR